MAGVLKPNLTDREPYGALKHENTRPFTPFHLFIIGTQGAGAYPTVHCARKETLQSGHHPSPGSLFIGLALDMDVFGLFDGNLSSSSERLDALHREDGARELETSCRASAVLTTESLCRFTRTTYRCHSVRTEWSTLTGFESGDSIYSIYISPAVKLVK